MPEAPFCPITNPATDTALGKNRYGETVYQSPDKHRYWYSWATKGPGDTSNPRSATVHWPSVLDPKDATTRIILAAYFTTQELAQP